MLASAEAWQFKAWRQQQLAVRDRDTAVRQKVAGTLGGQQGVNTVCTAPGAPNGQLAVSGGVCDGVIDKSGLVKNPVPAMGKDEWWGGGHLTVARFTERVLLSSRPWGKPWGQWHVRRGGQDY